MFHSLYHHLWWTIVYYWIPRRYLISWLNTFSKISSEESFSQDLRDSVNERENPDFHTNYYEYYNILFTIQELRHAVQYTKNSSPGEDTIFSEMVNWAYSHYPQVFISRSQIMPVWPHCHNTLTVQNILIDCVHFAD